MAGCCDRINISNCLEDCQCGDIEIRHYRNEISSILSGGLFFIGWWFIIYAAAAYPSNEEMPHAMHVCGVVSTLAFIIINSVSNSQIRGDGYTTGGCLGTTGARIWVFVGFLMGFSALISSMWILFGFYVAQGRPVVTPGVCIFLQNFLILIGSFIFKFGRAEDIWR